ncbi:RNA methyltransferase [Ilyomonas limi]|uniref:RNA methyltransferase n=1 Tax=Ilyomonas limi TaxID=2575867 RepID=A0A4U3L1M1_9BACT|nr:RNA methyltransferase [Ilyomonas limi]TKK68898.1 RNA methyltransferase [Ilyomonas limi]
MISKNEVKYIQSLSHKKNRDAEGVFIAETPKLVNELLQSSVRIKKIYATKDWQPQGSNNVVTEEIDEAALQRISQLETPNKVLAVAEKKKLPSLQLNSHFTLVLDGIQDPGNMGTIVRIADWFGITQIVAAKDTADCYNPKAVQSSMGSIARVHVWYDEPAPILANAQVPVFGALLQGKSVYEIQYQQEGILVIGNESKGIREQLLPFIQQAVTIPRTGAAESLNAAVATGILLSHILKQ